MSFLPLCEKEFVVYQLQLGCKANCYANLSNLRYKSVVVCGGEARFRLVTVVDWFSFYRDVAIDYCVHSSAKLSGVGKAVEVHEAKFNKRIYIADV